MSSTRAFAAQFSTTKIAILFGIGLIADFGVPSAAAQTDCFGFFSRCFEINGSLSEQHVNDLSAVADDIQFLVIDSKGGGVGWGMGIGQIVLDHDLPVYVRGICASACFEFVLPAAQYVVAMDAPIFAVHSNPLIIRDMANEQGIEIQEHCAFHVPMQWLDEVYELKDLDYSFVELQRSKTGSPHIDFILSSDGCAEINLDTYVHPQLWRVPVEVIRDVWGLDIRTFSYD
ncbi:MAG: hypothetical protein AAFQ15_06770 [Pseudomonadota bacterium]